jgi:hypothetical protein
MLRVFIDRKCGGFERKIKPVRSAVTSSFRPILKYPKGRKTARIGENVLFVCFFFLSLKSTDVGSKQLASCVTRRTYVYYTIYTIVDLCV